MAKKKKSGFECKDCSVCTLKAKEYYMVNKELWDNFGCGKSMLCIECLESRMGRTLKASDFTDAPINWPMTNKSLKLQNRIKSKDTIYLK